MPKGSFAWRDLVQAIEKNDTAFDTRIADNTVNRLDLPGTYQADLERHRLLVNGTFIRDFTGDSHFTDLAGKYQVTATAGDEIVFGAREPFRYVPNYEALWGVMSYAETDPLASGHTYEIELSDATQQNGYVYRVDGDGTSTPPITLAQISNGSEVDTVTVDQSVAELGDFSVYDPWVARAFLNWYGAGLARYDASYPRFSDSGDVYEQGNVTLGRTANANDVSTQEINLTPQVRVTAEAGAPDLTVNICSIGALIRGNAQEFDRERSSVFWDLGGSISQYFTDNEPVIAGRVTPTRRNVVVKIQPPIFAPNGSGVTMSVIVGAVHKDNTDLTVNFDDPDNDGTDEGPAPGAQTRAQTDVMQWTRDVTAYPTTTDIRADGTEGLVPDVRELGVGVASSGSQQGAAATEAGELASIKRVLMPEDVLLIIPRTNPAGNTTSGSIKYLKLVTEQDH